MTSSRRQWAEGRAPPLGLEGSQAGKKEDRADGMEKPRMHGLMIFLLANVALAF